MLGAGAILTAAVRALDWPRLSVALIALAAGGAYFTLPLAIRGTSEIRPAFETPNLGGSRYFVLPVLFLTLVLLLGLDARLEVASQQSSDPWLTVIALWLASLALLNYSVPNPLTPGPDWLTTLRQAQETCAAGQRAFVYVPIPPGGTWSVRTPCPR